MMNIENYIPHRHGMRLIDKIIDVNDNYALCENHINHNSLFYCPSILGIMPWIGIELMAQTVAVFAGFQQHKSEPDIGLLLSVRQFTCTKPYFPKNTCLIIKATKIYLEDNVGVFQCDIELNNESIASARLNTLQPAAHHLVNLHTGELS